MDVARGLARVGYGVAAAARATVAMCGHVAADLGAVARRLAAWLGPVASAVRGRINATEAARILLLGLSSGTLGGLLQMILDNVSGIVVDADAAAWVSTTLTVVTWVLDYFRRRGHGRPPG